MNTHPRRAGLAVIAAVVGGALTLAPVVPISSAALALAPVASALPDTLPPPAAVTNAAPSGPWKALWTTADLLSSTPAVWTDTGGRAWVLWLRQPTATTQTYEVAAIAPGGSLAAKPADVFAGKHWAGLSDQPTLLGQGGKPLVVFDGDNGAGGGYDLGCIYGALGTSTPWALQPWSLSASCANAKGGAAQSSSGVLAAAWPGGWNGGNGVLYRIGTSPSRPASGSEQHIAVSSGDVMRVGIANDTAGGGHFTVAWARENSGSSDGLYAKDVTSPGPVSKAPGSGSNTLHGLGGFATIALTSTNTHAGTYLAYCSNSATSCTVQLWKVGANKAISVPGSAGAADVALSAGPSGRLWIAWYNESTNRVSVVRTDTSDTKFGKVSTYATPCFEHGLLGLSSGSLGRVDIALQCLRKSDFKLADYYLQSKVALKVALSRTTVRAGVRTKVKVRVTDAGQAVAGAKVKLPGHTVLTNARGKAKLVVKLPSGGYLVKAKKAGYAKGRARLKAVS